MNLLSSFPADRLKSSVHLVLPPADIPRFIGLNALLDDSVRPTPQHSPVWPKNSPMSAQTIHINRLCVNEAYTHAMACAVADVLLPGDVIALEGDLGAGKTTFTRSLAQSLGTDAGLVSSPTFVIVNEYPLSSAVRGIARVIHADAYRLTSTDDLDALGWDRFTTPDKHASRDAVLLIEWPSRIADALPPEHLTIRLTPHNESDASTTARQMDLHVPQAWRSRPRLDWLIHQVPVTCRVTGQLVHPTSPSYPFIDDRAKMADLNRWFSGSYSITRPLRPDDEEADNDRR